MRIGSCLFRTVSMALMPYFFRLSRLQRPQSTRFSDGA